MSVSCESPKLSSNITDRSEIASPEFNSAEQDSTGVHFGISISKVNNNI